MNLRNCGVRAEGIFYMSRHRPATSMAGDGTFAVTLHVYDRTDPRHVTPWRVVYSGEAARAWFAQHSDAAVPGAALYIEAQDIQAHVTRGLAPEVIAHAATVQIVPRRQTTS